MPNRFAHHEDYSCYLFYGLTWVDVGLRDDSHRQQAINEARWSLQHCDDENSKAPFPADLPPDHGMFYSAWKVHLLGGVALLENGENRETIEELQNQCDKIAVLLASSPTPFPPSYDQDSWPCDTIPAIHAMSTHDHVTGVQRYSQVVRNWIESSSIGFDKKVGLLAHQTDNPTGYPTADARATSQAVILRMLPDIDSDLARQQYELYREQYFDTFLGMPCVREYPHGVAGSGDVDSGPLIFGRCLSATVMTIGIAQIYGDQEWADAITQTGEVVGVPLNHDGQRFYAFGQLPIGDEMVAYSYSARPWFATKHQPESVKALSQYWRMPVHFLTLLTILATALIVLAMGLKPSPSGESFRFFRCRTSPTLGATAGLPSSVNRKP